MAQMNIKKIVKNWQLNRKWKKEYGTDTPSWAKKDLSQINELLKDPDYISWYNELKYDKRQKADRIMNDAFNLVDEYYDKLIEGIEKELMKRGEPIVPETTRE